MAIRFVCSAHKRNTSDERCFLCQQINDLTFSKVYREKTGPEFLVSLADTKSFPKPDNQSSWRLISIQNAFANGFSRLFGLANFKQVLHWTEFQRVWGPECPAKLRYVALLCDLEEEQLENIR